VKDAHQLWPTPYVFKKPVILPAGSVLQAVAYADAAQTTPITLTLNHYAAK
jgi:hypothetical protein